MSVAATDIQVYGAAIFPTTTGVAYGGAIDLTTQLIFSNPSGANTLADKLNYSSTSGQDITQTVLVSGKDSTGVVVTETANLSGLTIWSGTQTFQSILQIGVSANHSGIINIVGQASTTGLASLSGAVNTIRRPFFAAVSQAAGGSTNTFYEKCFFKNTNVATALTSCVFNNSYPGTGLSITFALSSGLNDTIQETNNTVAPTGAITSFVGFGGSINMPSPQNLGPGVAQGVFLGLSLPAATSPSGEVYQLSLNGNTT